MTIAQCTRQCVRSGTREPSTHETSRVYTCILFNHIHTVNASYHYDALRKSQKTHLKSCVRPRHGTGIWITLFGTDPGLSKSYYVIQSATDAHSLWAELVFGVELVGRGRFSGRGIFFAAIASDLLELWLDLLSCLSASSSLDPTRGRKLT